MLSALSLEEAHIATNSSAVSDSFPPPSLTTILLFVTPLAGKQIVNQPLSEPQEVPEMNEDRVHCLLHFHTGERDVGWTLERSEYLDVDIFSTSF